MTGWAWLVLVLLSTAAGQLLFKQASERRSRGMTVGAVALFCLTPPASYFALHTLSLATVYVSTAITQILVVVVAMLLFGERYSTMQWAGFVLILAGVATFNLPSPA
jgi:multidrug transporter EmrE-like cation transporter